MSLDPSQAPGWRVVSPLAIPDWDQNIQVFSSAGVFHRAAWVRTLVGAYGHQPAFIVWPHAVGLAGVLPLMEVSTILGNRVGVSLPFTDACPPLVDLQEPDLIGSLFDAAMVHGRTSGWKSVEFRGAAIPLHSQPSATYFAHELDLSIDAQTLLKQFTPAVRRALHRAQNEGVHLDFISGLPAIEEYFKLHCGTRKRHGLPPQPWRFFRLLANNLTNGRFGFVARARFGSQTIAAAIFLMAGDLAYYKYGASDPVFQRLRPNNLLMWGAINRLASLGCKSLDFGRTSLANEGLRRFKLGWGAVESKLHYYRVRVSDGTVIPAADRSTGWHTAIFRRMPIGLLKFAGKFLYRFIN